MSLLTRAAIILLIDSILATLFYIGGRIIIADMGLTPPDWQAWFWFTSIVVTPILYVLIDVTSDLSGNRRYW